MHGGLGRRWRHGLAGGADRRQPALLRASGPVAAWRSSRTKTARGSLRGGLGWLLELGGLNNFTMPFIYNYIQYINYMQIKYMF